ncbi:MAG: dCTP deaminase domain-containing protein [Methylococcales bacterium]
MNDIKNLDFPMDDTAAEQRFKVFEKSDPFDDISSALLNSADIYDYVRVTGMIYPFEHEREKGKLKSASYEVDFIGDLYIFNNTIGRHEVHTIERGKNYTLPMNSISFLFTHTVFRLPDYIAARFNLRIKLVHAGLLLGTGPLIDPGFAGKLLIPLHNLTSENFDIRGGEGLIWVEFTKLSPIKEPAGNRKGEYRPFPSSYRDADATQYLKKASRSGLAIPARSSIPDAIIAAKTDAQMARENSEKASKSASEASEEAKKISDRFRNWGIFGIAALVVALGSLVISVLNLIDGTARQLRDKTESLAVSAKASESRIVQIEVTQKSLSLLQDEITNLKNANQTNNNSVVDMENRIKKLEAAANKTGTSHRR